MTGHTSFGAKLRSTQQEQPTETLVAGRELDALVAEKVMGLIRCEGDFHDEQYPNIYCYAEPDSPTQGGELKAYSTDISAAWEVVTHFANQHYFVCVDLAAYGVWTATFGRFFGQMSTSAPEAICLAALQAVEK